MESVIYPLTVYLRETGRSPNKMCAGDFKRYRFLTKCILQDFLDGLLTDIKGNRLPELYLSP
ncbi:MAG: hypothetical protein ACLRS8_15195 [Parabacteroides merdae]